MPKVTQQHRDARREQILAAARRCFLRNGFQATSMQDLFAESQLSSGAFYLYFKSKDDVILAIAEENLLTVTELIHHLAVSGSTEGVGQALAAVLETVQRMNSDDQLGAMAVLAWSEALRSPRLQERFVEVLGSMRDDLTDVVANHQEAGSLPSEVPAAALAKLLIAIVPGAILQLALLGEDAVDGVPAAAKAIL
jgi:AcrR family transcriptional regulator